jgi:hypothetical protein
VLEGPDGRLATEEWVRRLAGLRGVLGSDVTLDSSSWAAWLSGSGIVTVQDLADWLDANGGGGSGGGLEEFAVRTRVSLRV